MNWLGEGSEKTKNAVWVAAWLIVTTLLGAYALVKLLTH